MALRNTLSLSDVNARDYDGIFFAGGHGTMEDLPTDANVIKLVEQLYKEGKPVASVCHGPACLENAKNPKGEPIIKGKRFTCFSDAEEIHIGVDKFVPLMLESRLKEQGGTRRTRACRGQRRGRWQYDHRPESGIIYPCCRSSNLSGTPKAAA